MYSAAPLTLRRLSRPLATLATLAVCAAVLGACGPDDHASPATDSALARDLALASQATQTPPEFVPNDVASDAAGAAPSQPEPAPTPRPSSPAPAPRPRPSGPARTAPRTPERKVERPRPARERAPAPTPASPVESPTASAPESSTTPAPAPAPGTPSAPGPQRGVLPAGTAVGLATNQRVCTASNRVGDKLTATVSEDVVGPEGVVIPSGARAVLEVASIDRGQRAEDTRITFRVRAIYDGTRALPVKGEVSAGEQLQTTRTTSKGTDAKKVIGGAIVGAILGQAVGKDTKGTVIGAAAGAAAGTAAAKVTSTYEGCLPEGAPLRLTVAEPVQVAGD